MDQKFCEPKIFGPKILLHIFQQFQKKLFCCQTPVQLQSGVDFVLLMSQEEQEQPPPKSKRMKCTTDLEFGTKT